MIKNYLTLRTVLKYTIITLGLLLALVYIAFQSRYMIIGPQIVLSDDLETKQNNKQIFLTGTAYNISHFWLNDRPIYTDAQGNFKEALVLENGYTVATLRAEDRYGRTTTITRPFIYSPASFIP